MDHIIVHFEIPATDQEALAAFYRDLFGWKFEHWEGGEYWTIETAPERRGANGGMMRRQTPEQQPINYISVESVEQYSRKIEDLGGTIVMPRTEVPNMGFFAIGVDPQGNSFGIWEPKMA